MGGTLRFAWQERERTSPTPGKSQLARPGNLCDLHHVPSNKIKSTFTSGNSVEIGS